MIIEEKFMWRCLELARCGAGHTEPNPMVGAVVVHDGKIIGEGYHRKCGEGHAEVNAIASVRDESLLRDATLYVSLEPCSHYGKTPPCAELILRKRIPRVVVGCMDPFPEVSGRGVRMLREGGVEVVTGVLEPCLYDCPDPPSSVYPAEVGTEPRRVYRQSAHFGGGTPGCIFHTGNASQGTQDAGRFGGHYGRDADGIAG